MEKDTKNKPKKQEMQEDLTEARETWQEEHVILTESAKRYGFESIEEFAEAELNIDDWSQPKASAYLDLKDKIEDLLEQKKLLWLEEYIVEMLNKKHAIVHSGQTYVLTEKENPVFGGKDFSLESRQSFKMFYEDETIQWHNGKMRPIADIWLKSPLRRKYSNIIFDPTMDFQQAEKLGLYNLWKGFSRPPKKGNCLKYWNHVKNNICSKNEKSYAYVRKWVAYIFQHPDEVHTALVICGSQGVGKNSFVEPLGVLLGSHYVLLSNIHELVSNFNFHLKNAVLIHANEAFWGGNKKDIGTLKAMITEKTCLIEGKGKDRIMVRNYKHVIMSSNEDWPVHLDPDDRRFYVLNVSEEHKEDNEYFKAIQDELDNGGYEALLYDLLHEDLTYFNPRRLPASPYAFDIKIRGANSAQRYLYDFLFEDRLSISNGGNIFKEEVYGDYKQWCEDNGEKSLQKNILSKTINKFIPSIQDFRPGGMGPRKRMYKFPSLEQARRDFCKGFKEDYERLFGKEDT